MRRPDDAELLELLLAWSEDEETRERILVENPASLSGLKAVMRNGAGTHAAQFGTDASVATAGHTFRRGATETSRDQCGRRLIRLAGAGREKRYPWNSLHPSRQSS